MSNNKKIEAKDYPNVFAFIAAVIEAGRELQLQPQAGTGWASVAFTDDIRSCGQELYAGTLIMLFKEGRLRVKPKKRTVEGWVVVTKSVSVPSENYLPWHASSYIYSDVTKIPLEMTRDVIPAKVIFEVEE
jgi:hypothetical protein